MKLLIIRPQPGADATAARVRSAGHDAVVMPMFEVQPIGWDVPPASDYDGLLLTSGNAVRLAGEGLERLSGLPVFAVGSATARALSDAGLKAVAIGDGGAAEILATAQKEGKRRLLWLAGEDHFDTDVPVGITLDLRIVYRSAPLAKPDDFAAKVGSVSAILLHSPRAARRFAQLCGDAAIDRSGLVIAALSPTIAENAGNGWRAVVIATAPNDGSLLSQLQSSFTNISRDP